MEPDMNGVGTMSTVDDVRRNDNRKLIIMAIVSALLAALVTFMIVSFVNKGWGTANKDNRDVNVGVSNGGVTADNHSSISTSDYIYLGDWGLKIKKSEQLGQLTYTVFAGTESEYENGVRYKDESLLIWAISDSESGAPFADYLNNKGAMAIVTKTPIKMQESCDDECGRVVYRDSDYVYVLRMDPDSSYYGSEGANEGITQGQELEKESLKLIEDWLTNEANYARF